MTLFSLLIAFFIACIEADNSTSSFITTRTTTTMTRFSTITTTTAASNSSTNRLTPSPTTPIPPTPIPPTPTTLRPTPRPIPPTTNVANCSDIFLCPFCVSSMLHPMHNCYWCRLACHEVNSSECALPVTISSDCPINLTPAPVPATVPFPTTPPTPSTAAPTPTRPPPTPPTPPTPTPSTTTTTLPTSSQTIVTSSCNNKSPSIKAAQGVCSVPLGFVPQYSEKCIDVHNGMRIATLLPGSAPDTQCAIATTNDLRSPPCSTIFDRLACSVGCQQCNEQMSLLPFPGRLLCRTECEKLLEQNCPLIFTSCAATQSIRALCHSTDNDCTSVILNVSARATHFDTIFAATTTARSMTSNSTTNSMNATTNSVASTSEAALPIVAQAFFLPVVIAGGLLVVIVVVAIVVACVVRSRRAASTIAEQNKTNDGVVAMTTNDPNYGQVPLQALQHDTLYALGEAALRDAKNNNDSASSTLELLPSLMSSAATASTTTNAASSHYSSPSILANNDKIDNKHIYVSPTRNNNVQVDDPFTRASTQSNNNASSTASTTTNYVPISSVPVSSSQSVYVGVPISE